MVNYSPTLSSLFIFIDEKELVERIAKEMMNLRETESNNFYNYEDNKRLHYVYSDDNLKITTDFNFVKIEFQENKPPHFRQILSDQLNQIIKTLSSLNIEINKIEDKSWFSIFYSPFKSSKQIFANTSFLTFYQINPKDTQDHPLSEIPLIGILPIRMDDKIWLYKINKSK